MNPSSVQSTDLSPRRRIQRTASALAAAVASLTLSLVGMQAGSITPAFAAPAAGPGALSVTAAGTFASGSVPDGTCRAVVLGVGGSGASSTGGAAGTTTGGLGAPGAAIGATFEVIPGQAYAGAVGGGGGIAAGATAPSPGGVSGVTTGIGGKGGTTSGATHPGGSGGGRTELLVGGVSLLIAGGGGGGGASHSVVAGGSIGNGGRAGSAAATGAIAGLNGNAGADGTSTNAGGAGGGTGAGGLGGVSSGTTPNGFPGTGIGAGVGGNGGNDTANDSGGGGGGGYTGGGGGASTVNTSVTGAGGGGGSSYIALASPVPTGMAATAISGSTGAMTASGAVSGANGSLNVDWRPCIFDLALTKSASPISMSAGGTATWTIAVKNNGPDPMTKGDTLDLTDTLPAGPNGPSSPAYKVLSVTTSGGSNANMASGAISCSGVTVGSALPTNTTCSRTYDAPSAPGAPTGGLRGLNVGETLTITYEQNIALTATCPTTITNVATIKDRPSSSGTTDVIGVTVTDTVNAPLTITCPPALKLVKALSGSRLAAADQFTMSLTPSGLPPAGGTATTAGSGATVNASTGVLVVPQATAGLAYSFGEAMAAGSASAISQYGQSVSCVNSASGSATVLPASGSSAVPFSITPIGGDNITCTLTNAPLASTLTIVKSSTTTTFSSLGASVPYSFVVKNTGATTLNSITVSDPNATGITCPATSLAPGASTTCTATHVVTQADLDSGSIVNKATVTGTPPGGSPIPVVNSLVVTIPATQSPSITIQKSTTKSSFSALGESIPYSFLVKNTGNVTLSAITVSDPKVNGVSCPTTSLAPGASTTCTGTHTVVQADLDNGSVINTASVVATSPNGSALAPQSSNQVTVPALQTPALTIVKSSATTSFTAVGQSIAYDFVVTNKGTVTLSAVTVTDPLVTGIICTPTLIAPGGSSNCTGTYVVTQTDLNAGSISNMASVSAKPPTGPNVGPFASNVVTIPAVQNPAMTIVKTASKATYSTLNESITYTFVVTNTGNVLLNTVTVTDPKATGITCDVTTLAPGEFGTCTGTHLVTQADLDSPNIVNIASVVATPPSGTPTSPILSAAVTIDSVQNPKLTVAKSTTKTNFAAVGETIPYSFLVTNEGNVTITSIAVTDPKTSGVSCPVTTLAPGATTTCTGSHTVTQSDLDAGKVVNTAQVTGTPPNGPALAPVSSNTIDTPAVQQPLLSIVKSTTAANFSATGETIAYSFAVKNVGNVTMTAVTVTDPLFSSVSCGSSTLAPGASTTCTGSYTTTQADVVAATINNTAAVAGTDPTGTTTAPFASNTVKVPLRALPKLTIVKATPATNYSVLGSLVDYTFTVTNTGNVPLSALTVSDPNTTGISCPVTTLALGASTICSGTHTVNQVDLDTGSIINTATVVATPPSGTPLAPLSSNTVSIPAVQTSALTILKETIKASFAAAGESIPYTFTVTNTGNVTMSAITVSDPKVTGLSCPTAPLAPGANVVCSAVHAVTQGDLDAGFVVNSASVVGTPPSGTPIAPVTSNTVNVPAVASPSLSVVKATTTSSYSTVGQLFGYTFTVKNTGNVTMSGVAVSDAQLSGISCALTTLAPGATTTCTGTHAVTQGDLNAGSIVNTASVVGTPPNGTPISPISSNTVTAPANQTPALSIVKASTATAVSAVGDVISYTFSVTNNGNVTLTSIAVTDANATGMSCVDSTLLPGASTTCSASHVVTQADLDSGTIANVASVIGTPPSGTAITPVTSNTVTVPVNAAPSLSIVKASPTTSYSAVGNTITYTFNVTNTGNVTMSAVSVVDPTASGITCPATTLFPGASTTCTGTHLVTQADLDGGAVMNTASAVATPPNGTPIPPVFSNTVTVPAIQGPALSIVKSTTTTNVNAVGDTIAYRFKVTNTGNVTMGAITLSDPNAVGISCPTTPLAPGSSTTCTATHNVTQADLDAGTIDNTASVVGTPPSGTPISPVPSNSVSVPVIVSPALSIVKGSSTVSYATVGVSIPYTFTVQNLGNVTLNSIVVSDPNATAITCPLTTLAPSASTSCTGTHTVTQNDLDSGSIINTATVRGTTPLGATLSPVPSNTIAIPAAQTPSLTIVKATTTLAVSTVGTVIPYNFDVTNNGNVTLSAIIITDTNATGITCPTAPLSPGATVTCTASHTVTQADLDAGTIQNTASVVGKQPNGALTTPVGSNTVVVPVTTSPSLSVVKATSTASFTSAGDVVSYTFTVTNTGNLTMHAIAVTDPQVTGISCPVTTLAPGASTICTATHVVTLADLNTGSITNTASVVGTPPNGTPIAPASSNTVIVAGDQAPALTVVKSTTKPTFAVVGEPITYSFVVTNTGNVTVSAISVNDPIVGVIICTPTSLDPGQVATCSGTRLATQADLDTGSVINTATVSGTTPSGQPLTPVASNIVTVPATQSPGLTIVKSTLKTSFSTVGELITYTFHVTNVGNVNITAVKVTDPIAGSVTCSPTALAPAQSVDCTASRAATQSDLNAGSIVNTASVVGTPPSGTPLAPVGSNIVTVPAVQAPSLSIAKSTTATAYAAVGDAIPYKFTVTNTGNVTLTNVVVADPLVSAISCDVTTLLPGAKAICVGTHTVTQGELDSGLIVNTATATATQPIGTPLAPVSSNTITVPATQTPSLSVVKSTLSTWYNTVGDSLVYGFAVTNTGNVTMSQVAVTDPKVAGVSCLATTLAPGASTTCSGTHSVTQADLDSGTVVNTAEVTGTPPGGSPVTPLPSNTVNIVASQTPALSIVKATTTTDAIAVNQTIPYTFTVTNTGNVTVSGVAVSDPNAFGIGCGSSLLAPGASTVCTGFHWVTAAELDGSGIVNTASVVGTPPTGSPIAPVLSNTVVVPTQQLPSLSVTKATSTGSYATPGATVSYTFRVVNTGNVTLVGITIVDPQLTGISCAATSLAGGDATTCSGVHTVVQADIDAGSLVNTASATATPPSGSPVAPVLSNTVTVPAIVSPALGIVKATTSLSYAAVNEEIPFTFTVRNSGNATMFNVTVTDTNATAITCPVTTLAVLESMVCTGKHIVTLADLNAGFVANTAEVHGNDPLGAAITPVPSNTVNVLAAIAPSLSALKADNGAVITKANDLVNYTVLITNTGNVTLSLVKADDPIAPNFTCQSSMLNPGEATLCAGTHMVTQAEADAGVIVNTAKVTGKPPIGAPLTPVSSNTVAVPIVPGPKLALLKRTNKQNFSAVGESIVYTFDVVNTGNVTLHDVAVSDPNVSGVSCLLNSLAPGEATVCVGTHTVTQADVDAGSAVNTANVVATTPKGSVLPPFASNTVTVPAVQTPDILVVKAASAASVAVAGDVIPYQFTVTNKGNVTLSAITITDLNATGLVCPQTVVAPSQSTICTGVHTVTQNDLDAGSIMNVASVSATPPNGLPSLSVGSNPVTVPAIAAPALTIVKSTLDANYAAVNDTVRYDFVVRNSGNVTLSAIVVSDPKTTGVTCLTTTLLPTVSTTCSGTHTVTQADLDAGSIANTARVTGTPPIGAPIAPIPSNTVIVDAVQNPILKITKNSTTSAVTTLGQSIPYTFVVENLGNVTITGVVVVDTMVAGVSCDRASFAPAETITCSGTHQVTQAELDGGSVINTASISGVSPKGLPVTPTTSNTITIPVTEAPSLTLVKSTTTQTISMVGEIIGYNFTVKNTGNVTMHAVTVNDPTATGITCVATTLAPAQQTTCSGIHTVNLADLNAGSVMNTASVVATPPNGPTISPLVSNTVTVFATQQSALSISKVADAASVGNVGDTISYTFTVANTGNVTVHSVSVSDPQTTTPVCLVTTLDPGTSITCSATHVVTQNDLDQGSIPNTATVNAIDPAGKAVVPGTSNTVTVPVVVASKLSIVKSTTTASVSLAGDTIAYQFIVTNNGNVTVSNLAITDPQTAGVRCATTSLAPGALTTCTGIHTVTLGDLNTGSILNVASVTAKAPSGAQLAPIDSNTVTVPATQTASLKFEKAADLARVSAVGDVITYTFTVTNTGNVTIGSIAVSDPKTTTPTCALGTLDPGERTLCSSTKTVTQADLDAGSLFNVATVTGADPKGASLGPVPSNKVSVSVDTKPSMSIVKSTGTSTVSVPGAAIDYKFVVKNTGNVTLTGVAVTDPNATAISCPVQTLAPTESITCVGTHTVTTTDLDSGAIINVAIVGATSPDGSKLAPSASNPVSVPAIAAPALTVVKTAAESDFVAVGDVAHYSLLVTNTGNVTMHGIAVADPKASGLVCPATKLGTGASMTCTASHSVTQADLDAGSFVNVASVVGTPPNGAPITPVPSNVVTVPAVVQPAMTIEKVADATSVSKVGETINYTFTVTNTGNVTLSDVVVKDPKTTKAVCVSTKLASGEATTCTASHVVTQADLTAGSLENTATVNATVPLGSQAGEFSSNKVTVPAIQKPSLIIVKSTTAADFTKVGQSIPYAFVVTNTGNVPVSSITVSDPIAAPVNCPATTLAPGESMTCTGTHEVTKEEVTAHQIVNVASAAGISPLGRPLVPVLSNEVVIVSPAVAILYERIVDPTIPPATVMVEPLVTPVVVPSILTTTTTFASVVVPTSTAAVEPGELKLEKRATSTYSRVGDVVTYTFTLSNVGGSILHGAQITDTMVGLSKVDCGTFDGTLDQGESVSCSATYVVTLADVQRGQINNSAKATAVDAKFLKVLGNSTARSFVASPSPLLAFTGSNSPLLALIALLLGGVGFLGVRLARKRTR